MHDVVVKKFTFTISSPDEFLYIYVINNSIIMQSSYVYGMGIATGQTLQELSSS